MLARPQRLKKDEFAGLFTQGTSERVGPLYLRKMAENKGVISRFGLIVPSKAVKGAVRRNLLKRRLRYIIRKHLPGVRRGYLVAIGCTQDLSRLPFSELEATVLKLLARARLVS